MRTGTAFSEPKSLSPFTRIHPDRGPTKPVIPSAKAKTAPTFPQGGLLSLARRR